ncbi:MAG: UspA domain protein [Conexibacter sp.]|jgi:nucleotide-binding universal stress UspA family protein|nr:UspA domain protein [Conexibacter sp.]
MATPPTTPPTEPEQALRPDAPAADATPPLRELTARNVLVAVDGSSEAWHAVELAVQFARAHHGRIALATVVVPPPAWTQVAIVAAANDGSAERAAERGLRKVADAIPDEIPVTTILLHGDAAQQIARRAVEGHHDLVILGAREHGPIGAALESVSRRLLRCCRVPVLTVHIPPAEDAD